jgi:hypothetical protein
MEVARNLLQTSQTELNGLVSGFLLGRVKRQGCVPALPSRALDKAFGGYASCLARELPEA